MPMSRSRAAPPKRSKSVPLPPAARVAGHRVRQSLAGRKRVEVVVPARDIALIKQVAERLRAPPADAAKVRTIMAAAVAPPVARTGRSLIELLRSGPFGGVELEFERDRAPPRDVDL
jgi:hypothetical protein